MKRTRCKFWGVDEKIYLRTVHEFSTDKADSTDEESVMIMAEEQDMGSFCSAKMLADNTAWDVGVKLGSWREKEI